MNERIKLSPEVVREVRRNVLRANLAVHLARVSTELGDNFRAKQYRAESYQFLWFARHAVERDLLSQSKQRTAQLLAEFLDRFDKSVGALDEKQPEKVSISASSSRLPVRSLCIAGFFVRTHALHPRIWCPINVCRNLRAFGKLPAGWPPLPGKRPLVCGEGEVRLSSVQAAT